MHWQSYSGLLYGWLIENRAPHTNWHEAIADCGLRIADLSTADLSTGDLQNPDLWTADTINSQSTINPKSTINPQSAIRNPQ